MISVGLNSCNDSFPAHLSKYLNTRINLLLIDDLSQILLYDQISCPTFCRHDLIFLSYDFTLTFSLPPIWYIPNTVIVNYNL